MHAVLEDTPACFSAHPCIQQMQENMHIHNYSLSSDRQVRLHVMRGVFNKGVTAVTCAQHCLVITILCLSGKATYRVPYVMVLRQHIYPQYQS